MGGQRASTASDATFVDAVENWVRGVPPRRRGFAFIATSTLLVTLGTIGVLYDGNLVWINRLEHPFVFGCIAAAAFGAGVVEFLPWQWLRFLIVLGSGLVVLGWFVIGVFWVSLAGTWQVAGADAPGDREYEAVVREGNDWIDTVWYVHIRQTRGLLSREWLAGCISSDATSGTSIRQVTWQGSSRLFVSTAGAGITIDVDPRTGKPEPPVPDTARESC
jgi:hypothetical protein